MLAEVPDISSGCAGPPRSRGSGPGGGHLPSTSMAERNPSLTMLKHIEVMKIIRPGSAAT